jgi:signal transduction histidine kinase
MRFSLATNFSVTILGVVALAIVSSLVTWFAAWRIQFRLDEVGRGDFPGVRAKEVEMAILSVNNLISNRLLGAENPGWEEKLRELKPRFQTWIAIVRDTVPVSDGEKEDLGQLKITCLDLDARWEELVELNKQGQRERARTILLSDINGISAKALHLCDKLIATHDEAVNYSIDRARRRVLLATWVVGVSSALTLLLGGILLWLFFYRVLFPLRGMVADTESYPAQRQSLDNVSGQDELRIVANYLRNLMSDVNDTRSRLERSRNQLLLAEKLASVGKLAASVAHEIRNPLTAMKMWLFSIRETVPGNAEVDRKLGIVAEEIARLESVLHNFLEFSRPLTLDCRPQSVAAVIDQTVELLGPRFCSGGIRIVYAPPAALPPVMADADQLKQVLLNLLGNAQDAMDGGGEIRIQLAAEKDAEGRPMVVVRISDTGPGMPPDIQQRLFEPFFTTKDNGTGLGLCIVAQVMARHGGGLVLETSSERGTTFAIRLPVAPEEAHSQNPRS